MDQDIQILPPLHNHVTQNWNMTIIEYQVLQGFVPQCNYVHIHTHQMLLKQQVTVYSNCIVVHALHTNVPIHARAHTQTDTVFSDEVQFHQQAKGTTHC